MGMVSYLNSCCEHTNSCTPKTQPFPYQGQSHTLIITFQLGTNMNILHLLHQHIAQSVVLLIYREYGCIGNLCILSDGDPGMGK